LRYFWQQGIVIQACRNKKSNRKQRNESSSTAIIIPLCSIHDFWERNRTTLSWLLLFIPVTPRRTANTLEQKSTTRSDHKIMTNWMTRDVR
jgi:hypothetical protein